MLVRTHCIEKVNLFPITCYIENTCQDCLGLYQRYKETQNGNTNKAYLGFYKEKVQQISSRPLNLEDLKNCIPDEQVGSYF